MREQRQPMRRGREPSMDLPAGMTCADCVHCSRCTAMFGHIPEDETCDWSPSRFRRDAGRAEYLSWFPVVPRGVPAPAAWSHNAAIEAAHNAGFAGEHWTMGPEELALLLTCTYGVRGMETHCPWCGSPTSVADEAYCANADCRWNNGGTAPPGVLGTREPQPQSGGNLTGWVLPPANQGNRK